MNKKIIKRSVLISSLILGVSSISVTGYIGYNLIQRFDHTKTWKRVSKTPLADLTPELLSADEQTKDLIQKYNQKESEIWNSNTNSFKDSITPKTIDSLKQLHAKLPKSYQNSLKHYSEIISLYDILNTLNEYKESGIPEKKSLKDIQDYVRTKFDVLYPYLIEDNHKSAELLFKELQGLANDSNQYALVIDAVNQDYKIDKSNLKTDMIATHINYLNETISKLHYKWNYVENKLKPLIKQSATAVKNNETAVTRYTAYLNDQKAKTDFEQFESTYVSEENRLKSLIIDLPDFTNKPLNEVSTWAKANDITINIVEKDDSSKTYNTVLEQTPNRNKYEKITKGSTITITLNKKKQVKPIAPSTSVQEETTPPSPTTPSESSSSESDIVRPTTPTITRPTVPD